MKLHKFMAATVLAALLCACGNAKQVGDTAVDVKPALMWIDAEANFARFQHKDSFICRK